MSVSLCSNDDTFGPVVHACRDDFDFTQVFERIVLSIVPSAFFMVLAAVRLRVLSRRPRIIDSIVFGHFKVVLLVVLFASQLAILIVLAKTSVFVAQSLTLTAACVALVASLFSTGLSYLEHSRSLKPSVILESYLFATLLLDSVQTRTMWLSHQNTLAELFTLTVAIKVVAFCSEATPKSPLKKNSGEKHSPEETSGIFSLGVYSWINSLLFHGYRRVISVDDLFPLHPSMEAKRLYNNLTNKMQIQTSLADSQFEIVKEFYGALLGPFLYAVAPRLALLAFKLSQPFFIHSMLDYLSIAKEDRAKSHGYGLIGASLLIYTSIAISSGIYQYYNHKFVYMLRSSLHTAIFRKTTHMSLAMADDSAVITLMSTDLDRIVRGAQVFHELWAILAQVGLGCWLLQRQIGVAFVSPIAVIIVCAVLMAAVSAPADKRQGAWMEKIQDRVGVTATAIAKMKSYKISGLTEIVGVLIQNLRETEIAVGLRFRWLVMFTITLGAVPSTLSPVITFGATANSVLDVSTIFTSFSYIYLVTAPFTIIFNCFPAVISAFTCMKRIQKFLISDSRVDFRSWVSEAIEADDQEKGSPDHSRDERESGLAFKIENGNFGWKPENSALANLNCEIPSRSLTIVIGPVASGKSTLCMALLGEVPFYSGKVSVFLPRNMSIGYCQQDPFLYHDTIKNNIVGRATFSQQKLDEVIAATLLDADINTLPAGINNMVGSSGSTLSGGQKQRLAIARALYSGCKVLIFDDVLSGLDSSTGTMLFQRVFGANGFIKRKRITAVLCTNSIGHLPEADHIIVLSNNGTKAEQGPFETLAVSSEYVRKLDIRVNVTEVQALPASISETGQAENASVKAPNLVKGSSDNESRAQGDWSVYKHWFKSVHPFSTVSLIFWAIVHGFSSNFGTIWLNYWSQNTFDRPVGFYVGIYALLQGMFLVSWIISAIAIFIFMTTFAGSALHQRALATVVTAPMKLLTTTDIGVITNHFSQDLTLIDGELLYAFFNVALNSTEAFGMMVIIATAAPYLAIGFPVLFAVLYFVQRFYLRTSRQMRFLDLEAKSPLYTHFLDTVRGIATIRALGWEAHDVDYNDKLLDNSQRPAYLLAMIQQWLRVVMLLVVAGLSFVFVSLATQLDSNVGLVGTSLVTLLSFGNSLSEVVTSYTDLETSIGAVSRLKVFSASVTPEDRKVEDLEPPEAWPTRGAVELRNVSASYEFPSDDKKQIVQSGLSQPPMDLVLRDLSLSIPSGQKVAICGRTGSGKSTLMLLLLRLINPLSDTEETMTIDEVPLCRVKRGLLRKRIIALSQEATFLPHGQTIKLNIDPFEEATEAECNSVLKMVDLVKFVEERGGLQASMGVNDLSMGQRQLFCLGRAILRKRIKENKTLSEMAGGILLLDEVSSSVDYQTDRKIQEIVKAVFENYTVIAISHRLQTVVDYFDRVVVLDTGRLVESGTPKELIAKPGTYFGELWRNSIQFPVEDSELSLAPVTN